QRHRHERLTGSAGSPLGHHRYRSLLAALLARHQPLGQPGTSSGVPATTANRSAIPARVAVCSLAAGTGVPPGTGRSRVAVALATTVGREPRVKGSRAGAVARTGGR